MCVKIILVQKNIWWKFFSEKKNNSGSKKLGVHK